MPSHSTILKNFNKAKNASEFSDFPKQKLGAVLMQGSKVIAVGYNTTKTNPLQKAFNKYRAFGFDTLNNGQIHAEMMILLKTKYMDIDYSKTTLYIYREYHYSPFNSNPDLQAKTNKPALAKPCKACLHALWGRGITNIYYSDDNGRGWSKLELPQYFTE